MRSVHTVTITYDRKLVRHALIRFMILRLGVITFFALAGLSLFVLRDAYLNSWSTWNLMMGAGLGFSGGLLLFIYYARRQAAEQFFEKVSDPTVTVTFSEHGVKTESELGESSLKWSAFDELLKFERVWLLVYGKSGYITLPVEQLSADCRVFIESQVRRT